MNEFSKLVSDFFIRYLTNQKNASENTIKTYRDAVVQLLEFMNSKGIKANKIKITDFSYDIICEYLEWLESNKNVSVSTRNNRLAAIKSLFKYVSYHRPEYMNICTPILEIHKKKTESVPMNYLTVEAFQDMLKSFDKNNMTDLRDLAIILTLYESGARVSELVQIKVEHVQVGYYDIYTKGGKIRRIYIPKSLREETSEWLKELKRTTGYLFLNRFGQRITTRGIAQQLKNYAVKYGLNDKVVYPHSFRHRFAKNFLEKFNDISLLADLMGHDSIETTRIYLRRSSTEQQEIVDKIITW